MPDRERPSGDPRQLLREAEPQRRLDYLVGRATTAPSPYNTQPWRFRSKDPGVVDLQWDPRRHLREADPDRRLLFTALGAALENFLLAARDLGFEPVLEWLPDGEEASTVVRIRLGEPGPLPEPDPLVDLQVRRRTGRGIMVGPVESAVEEAVEGLDLGEVVLDWIPAEARRELGRIAGEAASRQWGRPAFRRELVAWLRDDRKALDRLRDGVALTRLKRLPGGPAWVLRRAILHMPGPFDPGRRAARRLSRAPAAVALSTPGDALRDWLATGRAYQRLGLQLAHAGLDLSPEAALVNDPEARRRAAEVLGRDHPQLVARVGRTPPGPPAPRRRLHRVLNPPAPDFPLYPRTD